MNTPRYPTLTHLVHNRDGPPTYFGESRTGLRPSVQPPLTHPASARPSLDESTRGRKKIGSTAGVIITRLLAVFVVGMVAASILGFTLFDRQGGTSATALVSLAIGGSAAVLWPDLRFPRGSPSELIQHALPGVQTQPSIDLHSKKDEVFCLATAAAPSYERGVSKEQVS